ncbi:MAG: hypothetical protein FJX76_24150, partial [Armatimonadetes bacterium]|nr:hypothetical protein [Armatimonadota bacterium]
MAMPIGDSSRMASLLQQQALLPRDATAETPPPTEDNDAFERGEQAPQGLMDRGRIQAQQARQSARGQRLDGGDDAARRMTDHHPQQASAEELRAIRRELKDAHKALRGDGVPDMRQRNEMTRIRGQLGDVNAGLARINDADRERKWEKVTDLVGHEPSGTYKAYFKASNVPMKEMAEVVRVADDLADPESARRTHGNDVKVLARDRMWAEKINLLDGAVREPVRGGKPVEIDVEYYELSSPQILNRLKQAANGGANVRVLVDSGRLDQGPGGSRNASSLAGRLNTLAQLQEGDAEKKPAVTLFANEKVLGSKQELMHRKLLRVGDDVVFGGMNANEGSGESVDFAMRIRGPAAGELVGTFREDVNASRGASDEEIFGKQLDDVRGRENITLDRRGVADFISALSADVPGTSEGSANERSAKQLEALEKKGVDVGTLVELPAGRDMRDYLDSSRDGHGGHLKMTEAGRHLLADQLEARVARTRKAENLEALSDISDPSTAKKASGGDTIAVADESVERQAAVLHAIDSAEKFVKVSAFVVTDDVAKSLIEKRDQMVAQGKPFDAQVMLDPGLYGHGG